MPAASTSSCSQPITPPDELLVNYYRSNLGFRDSNEHGTAIPLYDYACNQELKDIEIRREAFYADFNPDEEAM